MNKNNLKMKNKKFRKCFICKSKPAPAFIQCKPVCNECFDNFKNKNFSKKYLEELGFDVSNWPEYSKKYSWLDKWNKTYLKIKNNL